MVPRRSLLSSAQTLRRLLLALVAFTLLAACGTSPSAEPSAATSSSPAPSSAAPSEAALPSMPPFDHGEIPAEIVGRYNFEVFDKQSVIDLEADGTYVLMRGPLVFDTGTIEVRGEYGVFGDEMRFGNEVAVYGRACPPATGLHMVVGRSRAHLTVVEEPCPTDINRTAEWESGGHAPTESCSCLQLSMPRSACTAGPPPGPALISNRRSGPSTDTVNV